MGKHAWIMAAVLGLMLPTLLFYNISRIAYEEIPDTTEASARKERYPGDLPIYVTVLDMEGKNRIMELDAYLLGVVLGELPGGFHTEAIKAQVVAVRTLTLRRLSGEPKHGSAAVCMQSGCCQAFCSAEDYKKLGGSTEFIDRVKFCIEETGKEVLVYNEELIDAAYFSCSGGRTEDAVAVWGSDIPYLQTVESPGEEFAAHYTDTVTMDTVSFQDALGISHIDPDELYLDKVVYTRGGGVDRITISGITFTGMEVRTKLTLRSTYFTIKLTEDSVTITTKGFGHRVGLSQYGAEAMAQAGYSYEEILLHYYTGTDLSHWEKK